MHRELLFVVRMAARNLRRNTRRSLLTALAVLLGTALLTLGLAWVNGILSGILDQAAAAAGEVRVTRADYLARESMYPLLANISPVDPLVERIEQMNPGVRAYPLIRMPMTADIDGELGDTVTVLVGAAEGYYTDVLRMNERVIAGQGFAQGKNEVLVGRILAGQLGAQPGDEMVVLGLDQDGSFAALNLSISGIVDAGDVLTNRQVYVQMPTVEYLSAIEGGATEVLLFRGDLDGAEALAARVAGQEGMEGLVAQPWTQREPFRTIRTTLRGVFSILTGIIVAVTALVVLNTMAMSVMERTNEIGVLRAMGMSPGRAVGLFVLEGTILGLGGSVAGVALGTLPALWLQTYGVVFSDTVAGKVSIPVDTTLYARLDANILLGAFALGVLTSVLGAVFPALRAASIQPVDAMRRK